MQVLDVHTKEDFIRFLEAAQNTGMKVPENPDWQFIATLFHIGRIYE